MSDIQKLAADVNKRIDADLATAKEEQKPRLRFYKVSATLLAADLMQKESKDNRACLKMLNGFEETAKGLPQRGQARRDGACTAGERVHGAGEDAGRGRRGEEAGRVAAGGDRRTSCSHDRADGRAFAKAKAKGDKDAMRQNSAAQVALITPLIEQTKDQAIAKQVQEVEGRARPSGSGTRRTQSRESQYLSEGAADVHGAA